MNTESQHSRIIKMLRKAPKRGVPNWRFPAAGILGYTARMSELRKDGYNILVERQKLPNGLMSNTYHYFLIEDDSKGGMEYEK